MHDYVSKPFCLFKMCFLVLFCSLNDSITSLNGSLSALNTNLKTYSDGSSGINPHAYTANVTVHVARVSKIPGLNMAHLELVLVYAANVPSNTTFVILPESYRPHVNYGIPMVFTNSGGTVGLGLLAVYSNGNIQQGMTSSMRNILVDAWYPTA